LLRFRKANRGLTQRLRPRGVLLAGIVACASCLAPVAPAQEKPPESAAKQSQHVEVPVPLPKGKKLILKDGSFQLVREYQQKDDRVRYYSIERSAWEEIPTSLVDWDATRKAEVEDARRKQEQVEKLRATEAAERTMVVDVDVDASIQVAPGLFLPPGEGLFAVDGKIVVPLSQVPADIKLDKGRLLTQIIVPVPVVPSRHKVQIKGNRAEVRLLSTQPEFYLRLGPPDAEDSKASSKDSRPSISSRDPELELIRAELKGGSREIESVSTNVAGQNRENRKAISLLRWEVAKGVYRLTISEPLQPGEYVLAEVLPEGINLYVWDFGIDSPRAAPRAPAKASKP
jgi:hypothetical protein